MAQYLRCPIRVVHCGDRPPVGSESTMASHKGQVLPEREIRVGDWRKDGICVAPLE